MIYLDSICHSTTIKIFNELLEGILTERQYQNKLYYARKTKNIEKALQLVIAKELLKAYGR